MINWSNLAVRLWRGGSMLTLHRYWVLCLLSVASAAMYAPHLLGFFFYLVWYICPPVKLFRDIALDGQQHCGRIQLWSVNPGPLCNNSDSTWKKSLLMRWLDGNGSNRYLASSLDCLLLSCDATAASSPFVQDFRIWMSSWYSAMDCGDCCRLRNETSKFHNGDWSWRVKMQRFGEWRMR